MLTVAVGVPENVISPVAASIDDVRPAGRPVTVVNAYVVVPPVNAIVPIYPDWFTVHDVTDSAPRLIAVLIVSV
jgi:hypothetical protein